MELKQTKLDRSDSRGGSALIMVVVLTVLLAVIGVLFVMTARIDEMATSSVAYNRELDHAVESVVELISQRLADDLMGTAGYERSYDYPSTNERRGDNWLSTIEPKSLGDNGTPGDYTDDIFVWPHVSDLTGDIPVAVLTDIPAAIYVPADVPADANYAMEVSYLLDARADADGDGVTDSFWIRLPGITTGRGKPIFAAVRIIDNCAMLNLNTAHLSVDLINGQVWPPGTTDGRFLSTVDYQRFLRGADLDPIGAGANDYSDQYSIVRAKRSDGVFDPLTMDTLQYHGYYHQNAIMRIENPGPEFSLFDISDELEIRNRFMLTSIFQARFEREDVAYQTFDRDRGFFGGGGLVEQKVKRIPFTTSDFDGWKWRTDPNNFDDTSGAYVDAVIDYRYAYDRRHVCTFYSFDRNLRLGVYPGYDYENNEPVPPILDDAGNPLLMIFDPDPVAVCTRIADWDPAILPAGGYNYNNVETHVQMLKLLYAFRAYYLEKYPSEDFKQTARRAAQIVANMIDYVDDTNPLTEGPFFDPVYGGQTNDNPTYIDRNVIWQLIWEVSGIDIDVDTQYDFGLGVDDDPTDPGYPANREVVYGYERQPFISEIARYETAGEPIYYAIELCNPYDLLISLDGWQLKIGDSVYPLSEALGHVVPAMSTLPTRQLGRLVLYDNRNMSNVGILIDGMNIPTDTVVELQRPDPATPGEFITLDKTEAAQADEIHTDTDWRASKRDDTEWKFTNAGSYTVNAVRTLGRANAVSPPLGPKGYQMPVLDDPDNVPIGTLHDFEMVLRVGNEKSSDPNFTVKTVTEYVDAASNEGDIRTDVDPNPRRRPIVYPLDYICFVGRPEGTLPGRINVNTATKEVIRAAIPPDAGVFPDDYEALALNIVDYRREPFPGDGARLRRITHLLKVPGFQQFATDPNGIGDPDMRDDFEERDWILSQVANKFTVRSDVFTAYILVRLGHDGPQRRMIAIFDRSNVSKPIGNNKPEKPRIIALHPVPDPR